MSSEVEAMEVDTPTKDAVVEEIVPPNDDEDDDEEDVSDLLEALDLQMTTRTTMKRMFPICWKHWMTHSPLAGNLE